MALRGLGGSRLSKSLVDGDRTGNVVLSAKSMQIENIVQSAIGMEFKRNNRNRSPGNGHLKSSSRCVTPEIQLSPSENPSKEELEQIFKNVEAVKKQNRELERKRWRIETKKENAGDL